MANKTEIVSTINVETGEYGEFIVSKEVTSQNFIKVFMGTAEYKSSFIYFQ